MRLTPRAGADRVDGWRLDGDSRPVLVVRVRAAPIEGEANAALEALLAKSLGVARAQVSVARGAKGRLKAVSVEGSRPRIWSARSGGRRIDPTV